MANQKQTITMRTQLASSVRARPRDDNNHDGPASEPTLRDRLQALAPGLDDDQLDTLAESERARIRGDGTIEVATFAGWMPASLPWAAQQAASIAPRRPEPSTATHETVAAQLVNRQRPGKPTKR